MRMHEKAQGENDKAESNQIAGTTIYIILFEPNVVIPQREGNHHVDASCYE
jgi:hypothetical protein